MRSALFRLRFPAPAKRAKASGPTALQTLGALRRMSPAAIVAVAAIPLLGACGQRGPLYLPTVPPLPAPPQDAYTTPNGASGTTTNGTQAPAARPSGTSGSATGAR